MSVCVGARVSERVCLSVAPASVCLHVFFPVCVCVCVRVTPTFPTLVCVCVTREHRACRGAGVWDVEGQHANKQAVDPLATYKGHSTVVEDVAWHMLKRSVFGSVGDDKQLLIWDDLVEDRKPVQTVAAHAAEVNCLAFNPFNEHLLATGSADKTVAVWDMRNLAAKLHAFDAHDDEIIQVSISLFFAFSLFRSSASVRVRVRVLSWFALVVVLA